MDPHELPPALAEHWRATKPAARRNALQLAEEEIDRLFSFRGRRADAKQTRKWPRVNAHDDDGQAIEGIPEVLSQARDMLAAGLIAGYGARHPMILGRLLLILQPVLDPDQPLSKRLRG